MAKIIPVGTVVEIKSKTSWENGNWGVVKHFDGEEYHVAINNSSTAQLVFSRRELVVKPALQALAEK